MNCITTGCFMSRRRSRNKHVILTTSQRVLECVKSLPVISFTTCEIAEALAASGEFDGVSLERLERSVRQSVVWLMGRGMARSLGGKRKTTAAGNTSIPETYMIVRWEPEQKEQQPEIEPADFATLNRVFLGFVNAGG